MKNYFEEKTLEGHFAMVLCIAKLNDNTILSGSIDGSIKIWDITTGNCLKTLETKPNKYICCAIRLDKNKLPI